MSIELPANLKAIEEKFLKNVRIIKTKNSDGETIYIVNLEPLKSASILGFIELNGVPVNDMIKSIIDNYNYANLTNKFFIVEFNELPEFNLTTTNSTFAGWIPVGDENNFNLITQEEYAKLIEAIKIGSKSFPEYVDEIKDYADINYVRQKIESKFKKAYEKDKFDYPLKTMVINNIIEQDSNKFITSIPRFSTKHNGLSDQLIPGSIKVYDYISDFAKQLQDQVTIVNENLRKEGYQLTIYSRCDLSQYEKALFDANNIYESSTNVAKSFIRNNYFILTKLDEEKPDTMKEADSKARNYARNRSTQSKVQIAKSRLNTNAYLIQISLEDILRIKTFDFDKEAVALFNVIFNATTFPSAISWVGKPQHNYEKFIKTIATTVINWFCENYVYENEQIKTDNQLAKKLDSLSKVIEKVDISIQKQYISTGSNYMTTSVSVGDMLDIINDSKKIIKYLKEKNE